MLSEGPHAQNLTPGVRVVPYCATFSSVRRSSRPTMRTSW